MMARFVLADRDAALPSGTADIRGPGGVRGPGGPGAGVGVAGGNGRRFPMPGS